MISFSVEVSSLLNGGSISFKELIEVQSFKSWIRKEQAYASFLVILFVASFAFFYLNLYDSYFSFIPFTFIFPSFVAACFAWDVGKTKKSKLIVFILGAVLGVALGLVFRFTRRFMFNIDYLSY